MLRACGKKCAGPAGPGSTGEVRRDQTAVRRKWYQWRRTGCPYGQSGRSGK